MKILIAVVTCHKFRDRADAQRSTWVDQSSATVRFFVGRGQQERTDEVVLDVPDNYQSLPYKKRAMCRWALDHGYDWVLKCDDDVYLRPDRLLASDFQHDYVGTFSLGKPDPPYFSGFAHGLSRRSMEILAKTEIDDWAEDRWTGKTLHKAGIVPYTDDRYVIIHSLSPQNPVTGTEWPRAGNDIIAVAECLPLMMYRIHREWRTAPFARVGLFDRLAAFTAVAQRGS